MGTAADLVELFQRTRFDAFQAELSGDAEEALRLWLAMEGYIASTPDQERDGDSLRWRADVAEHVRRLQKKVAAERGIQRQKIVYNRATLTGTDCTE